jgi:hypothetical protein
MAGKVDQDILLTAISTGVEEQIYCIASDWNTSHSVISTRYTAVSNRDHITSHHIIPYHIRSHYSKYRQDLRQKTYEEG